MNAPRVRVARRPVHGVLLLDKPLGLSSNQALQKAKWLLRAEKAGHTGTLDPLATGVLPLAFGAATKFAQLQLDADKRYSATLRLGVVTTTGDAEGEVVTRRAVDVSPEKLASVLPRFTGEIDQVPPMYSALKHEGRALYEYARAGIEVERAARRVTILALDARLVDADTVAIDVRCSKGTYVRTLASEMGEALGCGAHLVALRRTGTGDFGLDNCITLAGLEALDEPSRLGRLLPIETLLTGVPSVRLEAPEAGRFLTGMRLGIGLSSKSLVGVRGPGPHEFLGVAHVTAEQLIPDRLLSPIEVKQAASQFQVGEFND